MRNWAATGLSARYVAAKTFGGETAHPLILAILGENAGKPRQPMGRRFELTKEWLLR